MVGSDLTRRNVLRATVGGALVAAAVSGGATGQQLVRGGDLIARWPFTSGFADAVGSIDGKAAYGDPTVGRYDGRRGVRFDGDDGIQIGSGEDNPEMSFVESGVSPTTVSGWVYFDRAEGGRPNNDPANHHILRNDAEYTLLATPDTEEDGTVEFIFGINDLGGGESYSTVDHADDELYASVGRWHHFAFVVEPEKSIRFHLDGEERFVDDDMDGYSPRNTNYWSNQTIGSWYGTGNPDWYDLLVGKLSDLRIYDVGLSAAEIERIYSNGSGEDGDGSGDGDDGDGSGGGDDGDGSGGGDDGGEDADGDGGESGGSGSAEPTAVFEYEPSEPAVETQIAFNAADSTAESGEIVSYEWEFGNGETGTGETVTNTYADPGGYNVRLTVTDDRDESASVVKTVPVAEGQSTIEVPGFGVSSGLAALGGGGYLLKRHGEADDGSVESTDT
ncbi:PKD domain-containing protein [Halorubrum rubrum]|uniref:PKD domain-containing protein n=1 Tax=Halorubrum rubrum TaxID=1126240 RepID=A0ABD5R3N7_9EURY|nr:PKD domain-containing protein [Halorubrum rubrum]